MTCRGSGRNRVRRRLFRISAWCSRSASGVTVPTRARLAPRPPALPSGRSGVHSRAAHQTSRTAPSTKSAVGSARSGPGASRSATWAASLQSATGAWCSGRRSTEARQSGHRPSSRARPPPATGQPWRLSGMRTAASIPTSRAKFRAWWLSASAAVRATLWRTSRPRAAHERGHFYRLFQDASAAMRLDPALHRRGRRRAPPVILPQ